MILLRRVIFFSFILIFLGGASNPRGSSNPSDPSDPSYPRGPSNPSDPSNPSYPRYPSNTILCKRGCYGVTFPSAERTLSYQRNICPLA